MKKEYTMNDETSATPEERAIWEGTIHEYCLSQMCRIFPRLKESGVLNATVSFDGMDDKGSIYTPTYVCFENGQYDGLKDIIEYDAIDSEKIDGIDQFVLLKRVGSMNGFLGFVAKELLDDSGVDWTSGDGGYGTLEIDIEGNDFELHFLKRTITVETDYYASFDVSSGDIDII